MKRYLYLFVLLLLFCQEAYSISGRDYSTNLTMYVGETITLDPKSDCSASYCYFTGISCDSEAFEYESIAQTNSLGVQVLNGSKTGTYYRYKLTALQAGEYTVTCFVEYYENMADYIHLSNTATYTIKVKERPQVESISIPPTLSLSLGNVYTFSPVINETETGASTTLTWNSSNTSVATIDNNGKLSAIGIGSSTITCTATNGVSAQCELTVNPKGDGLSLPYESFIVAGIGYKILTENTVAVTYRAQYPHEYWLAPKSSGPSNKVRRQSGIIEYLYKDISYSGKVVIPAAVTYDGITYTVTEIGDYAFERENGSWVTSLTIPYSVTKISSTCFYHLQSLNELILEDGDSEIQVDGSSSSTSVFQNQPIESLYLGRDNTNQAYCCFGNILKTVVIGDNVTSLASGLFNDCDQLTTVQFGANISSIGSSAFNGCTSLTSIDLSSKLTVIPDYAFYGCTALESVILPQGLTSIEKYAFNGCSSLKIITLPQGLTSIDYYAFSNTAITQISFPCSVTSIDGRSFADCTQLKDLIIEDGDTEISISTSVSDGSDAAFLNSPIDSMYIGRNLADGSGRPKTIRALAYGDKVTKLADCAGCTNLTSVYFGKNINHPGTESVFRGCTSLKHIDMTSSLGVIWRYSFEGCTALESVILPPNLSFMGEFIFNGCTSLKSITIPGTVTEIGLEAFGGCTNLKEVVFEDGEEDLYLENLDGSMMFNECPLDSVYLGRNLKKKTGTQYSYWLYTDLLFPSSLTKLTIGTPVSTQWAKENFQNCSGLTHIYPLWEQPIETSRNMFPDAVYYNATLIVPCGTVKKYQATAAWNGFAHIVPTAIAVTMTATEGGSIKLGDEVVSNDSKLLELKPNSVLTFEITPDDEYFLESVTINGEDVTTQVVEGMLTPDDISEDIEVVATFVEKPYYSITATSTDGGTAVVGSASVMWGRSTTVTLTTNEGHKLKSLTVNGVEKKSEVVNGVLNLSDIKEDKTVAATFQKLRYTVTAASCENGSIQLSTASPEWDDDVTVTITPAAHYNINKVLVNGEDRTSSLVGNKLTLKNVRGDMTIAATFSIQTFTVTASANKGGSIVLSTGGSGATGNSLTVDWGSSVTATLNVEEDYELVSLIVNGEEMKSQISNGTYKIVSVEADMTIEAVFKEIMEITLTDGTDYCRNREKFFETIHYSRTFKNTNWQAWYMPFDLTLTSEVMEHFAFAEFAGTYSEEDGSFYITVVRMKEGDVVKANTPYCVQAKVADKTNAQVITQTDAILKTAEETSFYVLSARKKITFCGNYTRITVTAEEQNWYALSGGLYSRQLPGNTIAPFRCFFTIEDREDNPYAMVPNPSEVKLMVVDGDETAIELLSEDAGNDYKTDAYDLSGRKVSRQQMNRGIYIINGKKVYVK